MSLYRNFLSQEEIDANYRTDIGLDLPGLMRHYTTESARVRKELPCRPGLKYGPTRAESLDFFPGRPGAPVLMFIHGGYWRLGAAGDFSVLAAGPAAHGIAVAVTNYALCPAVTIDEITRQNRAALAWLWHNAGELGIDRERIFIAGHSAGGQQVGMMLATDWSGQYDLPADVVKGALAVSGVFDLRPLRHSWLQPKLQLTADTIERQSPLFHVPATAPPLVVTCGGAEPAEFIRQSHEYLAAWQHAGLTGRFVEQPGANHFVAVESLADADGLLTKVTRELIAEASG
ncbi:MAG: alpha/beta hydrolase [Reyranellaceae bacterium]